MNNNRLYIFLLSTSMTIGLPMTVLAIEEIIPVDTTDVIRDSRGHIIHSDPKNLPFKLVAGVPEYIIGFGDILEVTLHRVGENVPEKMEVGPDGKISFSILFDIQAEGLTASELKKVLNREMSRYIRSPRIGVKVERYKSRRVLLLGAISGHVGGTGGESLKRGPGIYPLQGRTRAMSKILDAGGAESAARIEEVRLTRGGRTYTLNLRKALAAGDNSQNVILEHNDILFIAGAGHGDRRVFVLGEVTAQGLYTLEKATLMDALIAAGGFTAEAVEGRVHVIRTGENPHNPTIYSVNARKLYRGDPSQNMVLEQGDVVHVGREVLADVNHVISLVTPILDALFLPATIVSAYTSGAGIIPIVEGPGGVSFQPGQTLSVPAGTGFGAAGVSTGVPSAPKPADPKDED